MCFHSIVYWLKWQNNHKRLVSIVPVNVGRYIFSLLEVLTVVDGITVNYTVKLVLFSWRVKKIWRGKIRLQGTCNSDTGTESNGGREYSVQCLL